MSQMKSLQTNVMIAWKLEYLSYKLIKAFDKSFHVVMSLYCSVLKTMPLFVFEMLFTKREDRPVKKHGTV